MAEVESQPVDLDGAALGSGQVTTDGPESAISGRETDGPESGISGRETDAPEPAIGGHGTEPPGPAAGDANHDDLLGELARAMHAAAASQYERINAELEGRRAQQVEAIATRARSEIEDLKAGSGADIGAIDAWAKAETEKIKQERLRRIDARRAQLAAQLEHREAVQAHEVLAIEAAIDGHRTEIDAFFGRMERETDPAAIARVASMLPPFPVLAQVVEEAHRQIVTSGGASEEVDAESGVDESRLIGVMDRTGADPNSTADESDQAGDATTRPWEAQPSAVTVTAGPSGAVEAHASGRGGVLLRSIPSIRPMVGRGETESSEEPDPPR